MQQLYNDAATVTLLYVWYKCTKSDTLVHKGSGAKEIEVSAGIHLESQRELHNYRERVVVFFCAIDSCTSSKKSRAKKKG